MGQPALTSGHHDEQSSFSRHGHRSGNLSHHFLRHRRHRHQRVDERRGNSHDGHLSRSDAAPTAEYDNGNSDAPCDIDDQSEHQIQGAIDYDASTGNYQALWAGDQTVYTYPYRSAASAESSDQVNIQGIDQASGLDTVGNPIGQLDTSSNGLVAGHRDGRPRMLGF
jgi:hypothetical protein